MEHLAGIFVTAFGAFVAANIDDLLVLVLFFADERFASWQVAAGQYVGVTAIIGLCLAGSAVASFLPPDLIHGLGIVPIAVGVHRLLFRRETNVRPTNLACSMKVFAVAAVSFADCSDNIAVFTPFLAHLNRLEKSMVTFLFLVFIGLWCWFAWYLTHSAAFSKTVRTVGNVIAPWALIALGIIILLC